MSPIAAITKSIQNSFVFKGRASPAEYWWFFLFYFIGKYAFFGIHIFSNPDIFQYAERDNPMSFFSLPSIWLTIFTIWTYALLPAYIAVTWRRFHDSNIPGWWWLFLGAPYIIGQSFRGSETFLDVTPYVDRPEIGVVDGIVLIILIAKIVSLYFLIRAGTTGENRFGPPSGQRDPPTSTGGPT